MNPAYLQTPLAVVCGALGLFALTSCSDDSPPSSSQAGSTVVTQYVTETIVPDDPDPTPGVDSGDVGAENVLPDRAEPDGDFDPAFITTWAMHGERLYLYDNGTAVYHRYSGALHLIKWSATWAGSGRTVTVTLGDIIDSHGELDRFPVHSPGDQITGIISEDGTKMDITDPADGGRSIKTCRSDVYDQICGP
ncbi:hypothetical protein [Corynebacterium variabile]|uniref:hypothetical protein n=1 Tax=Corynebacterium variabile TaxID=1727 RepID=UPI003A940FD9